MDGVNSKPMPTHDERFIAALRAEAQCAARLNLDGIQRAFSAALPHLDGAPDRRTKLAAVLDSLRTRNIIRVPADRRRGWQPRPLPALPLSITFQRPLVQETVSFDHKSFPWACEMAFVAEFPTLRSLDDVMRLHKFFKDGGGGSPIVPTKERSWQIFGEEKRLEELHGGQLFAKGRLSLDLLRCRSITQILAVSRAPRAVAAPFLIVENESTFHSLCRLNSQLCEYVGVIFGSGNVVLKAVDFLHDLGRAVGITTFRYFGDLDPRGLRIPFALCRLMAKCNLTLTLEESLYAELLRTPITSVGRPQHADDEVMAWVPQSLREEVRKKLSNVGRVAQESLGWERLCALRGVDPQSDFGLGFSPRL